jgi:hypothetical protein
MTQDQVSYGYIPQNCVVAIASGCHWQEVGVCLAVGWMRTSISGLHGTGRAGSERRTTAAPVYCGGRVAVSCAREVGERSVRCDFVGAEWGDSLALDCGCMDKSEEHESEGKGLEPVHDHGDENNERPCADRTTCKHYGLYSMRESFSASSGYEILCALKTDQRPIRTYVMGILAPPSRKALP